MRRAARLAGRGLGALALLVLLVELGMRLAGVRAQFPLPCTWDARVGCVLDPSTTTEMAIGSQGFRFTTNEQGRRDRARGPKAPGVRRVVVLGDSVAFGAGVADDETFAARLEARLAPARIEIVNAASIFLKGTEQQLSYFVDHRTELDADLVVLQFNAQNDFVDNVHRYYWRRGGSGLERVERTLPPTATHRWVAATAPWAATHWLDAHSRVFGLARLGFWNLMHLPRLADDGDAYAATDDVVERLRLEARAGGAALGLAVTPSPWPARVRVEGDRPISTPDAIAAIAARHSLPLVDLGPVVAGGREGRELMNDDGHLTAAGHAAVADALVGPVTAWLSATGAAR